jgi:hypothetical protein
MLSQTLAESDERQDGYPFILINVAQAVVLTELDHRYREPIDLFNRARRFIETKPLADRPAAVLGSVQGEEVRVRSSRLDRSIRMRAVVNFFWFPKLCTALT